MLLGRAIALTFAALCLTLTALARTNADPPKRAGVNGVGVPTCQYCPAPANKKSENATVVLQVVVTLDGRAENISALKGLNDDLIQTAIDTVKTWRFKLARDANDNPSPR